MKEKIYIANDIETSGPLVGVHSILSWGACVVVAEESLTPQELIDRGLVFYEELCPISHTFVLEALKVGCLGLKCLKRYKLSHTKFDPSSVFFDPLAVLLALNSHGVSPQFSADNFRRWITKVSEGREVVPVVDTVFFDSVFLAYYFSYFGQEDPYGYAGLDLDSLYRGFTGNRGANLKELALVDDRKVLHCAEDDAIFLAKIARELLYRRMK